MSARSLLILAILALAAFLSRDLWLGSGGPELPLLKGPRAPTGNEENPDAGRLLDLPRLPFRPDWVGGTLRVGLRSPPSTLNNLLWTSPSDGNYHRLFLNPTLLIEGPDQDSTGSVHPHAAVAHPEVLDDGKAFVFTLKADLRWENGRLVSASDYAATLDFLRDPRIPCGSLRSEFESIESMKALDERRLEVRLREPTWNGGQSFGLGFRVMPVKEILESGVEMDPRLPVMGFGPYRVAESSQDVLLLVLRDAYREAPHPLGPRYAERIQFRFVADAEAAMVLMKAGEIDVLPVDVDKFLNARLDKELLEVAWRTSYNLPIADVVAFNVRNPEDLSEPHPILSDARIRRAFAHLFPREGILAEREGGLGIIHDGPFDFRDPGRAIAEPPLPFDPARAAALFDEAGFLRGSDGWRRRGEQTLRITIHVLAGRNYWTEPLSYFRSEARKVGADVDVKIIPSGLTQLVSSRRFDAFIALRRSSPMVAPDLYSDFHSSMARVESGNWSGIEDAELDSHLERLRANLTREERIAAQQAFSLRFLALRPLLFLYSRPSCILVSRRWANVKVHELGIWYEDFVLRSALERP